MIIITKHKVILKNISWLVFEKAVFVALVFFCEGMISRTLGVENYGKWLYSLNLVILTSSVSLIAGAELMVPALTRYKRTTSLLLSSAFIIRELAAFVAFIFLNLYAFFIIKDDSVASMLHILSFFLLISEPFSIVVNYFQANVNIRPIVLIRILGLVVRCMTVLFAIYFLSSNKPLLIYFSRVFEVAIIAFLYSFLIYKCKFKFSINYKVCKIVLFKGVAFWFPLILMYIYLRIDRIFVEKYLSYLKLAQYGVATQFIEQAFLLIGIIIQSVSPRYIYNNMTSDLLKRNINILLIAMFGFSVILQIFCFYLLGPLISLVFGDGYLEASELAVRLLPAVLFYSLDSVLMQYIYREKATLYLYVKWGGLTVFSCTMYYIWFGLLKSENMYMVYNLNYVVMLFISVLCYRHLIRSKISE